MDGYKKILRNKSLRMRIVRFFDFLPDDITLRIQYFIKTHRKLHLNNPKRWTEKIQWYKLYYKDPLMVKCVDKYEVRSYIESKGYGHLLNDIYWVGKDLKSVNWDKIPDRFVIKMTSGSGTNIIVKDKNTFDLDEAIVKTSKWLKDAEKKPLGREWPYQKVDSKLIIEKYIENSENGLIDYKFFCFNGHISHLLVISDRFTNEKLDLYDAQFNRMNVIQYDCPNQSTKNFPKPDNYSEMCKIAEDLSEDFPHVRVDLYNIKGKIMFGELTFFSGSGYYVFDPDNFDFELGERFNLPEKRLQ